MQESPLVPFPPEPTREEDEEQVSDNYQHIAYPDAGNEPKDNDWDEKGNAKPYVLLLIVRSSHRVEDSGQYDHCKSDRKYHRDFRGNICARGKSSSQQGRRKQEGAD